MKYLDLFKTFEYISNEKNLKFIIKKMLSEMNNIIDGKLKAEFSDYNHKLRIMNIEDKYNKKVLNIIKKYEKIFLERNNIIMNYTSTSSYGIKFVGDDLDIEVDKRVLYHDYYIIFKDINIGRIKPEKYLVHKSLIKYVESIEKEGLKLSKSQNYKGEELSINYPPAIFATSPKRYNTFHGDCYWLIDTTKCENKWYKDLNFPNQEGIYMTYEKIPKEALIYIGSGESATEKIKKLTIK